MSSGSSDVKQVIERILVSYGVKSRYAYSEITKVPLSTVSNWVARGNVPGDYLVQCALDTGVDLKWLVEGTNLTNVSCSPGKYPLAGKKLMEVMKSSGGKNILQRIMQAYGFTLQKELGDHLGIPSATMSAWVRRDHFPGDVVVICALDTGTSLYWLATGNGGVKDKASEEPLAVCPAGSKQIPRYNIQTGKMDYVGMWFCDESLLEANTEKPALIEKNGLRWLVDLDVTNIANGRWLIDVDGTCDVYDISRLPGNKLIVKNSSSQFECKGDEIDCVGMVFLTLSKNI